MYRVRICAALLLATLGLAGFKQQKRRYQKEMLAWRKRYLEYMRMSI